MSSVQIIALTGKARSGKDTAASILRNYMQAHTDSVDEFNECYVLGLEAFAAPIKSMVAMLLDFFGLGSVMNPEQLVPYIDGDKKEQVIEAVGASPRKLMQTLGTDWGRNMIDPNLWLNSMTARLKGYDEMQNHGYAGAVVVITDCRFDNEADCVHANGGIVVQIVRDEVPDQVGEEDHPSEAGLSKDKVDIVVYNNATVDALATDLIAALEKYLPPIVEREESEDEIPAELVDWFSDALGVDDADNDEEEGDAVEERSAART